MFACVFFNILLSTGKTNNAEFQVELAVELFAQYFTLQAVFHFVLVYHIFLRVVNDCSDCWVSGASCQFWLHDLRPIISHIILVYIYFFFLSQVCVLFLEMLSSVVRFQRKKVVSFICCTGRHSFRRFTSADDNWKRCFHATVLNHLAPLGVLESCGDYFSSSQGRGDKGRADE